MEETKAVAMGTEVLDGATIKKERIGLFLMMETSYKRIKKSTSLELAFEAETETKNFIADKTPTEVLQNYKVSIAQDLTMIKGEDDYEYVFGKVYDAIPDNTEVKTKCMVAFMAYGDKTTGYKAWETEASLTFDNINGVDSVINFNINFGDIAKGIAKVGADGLITFTEGN